MHDVNVKKILKLNLQRPINQVCNTSKSGLSFFMLSSYGFSAKAAPSNSFFFCRTVFTTNGTRKYRTCYSTGVSDFISVDIKKGTRSGLETGTVGGS